MRLSKSFLNEYVDIKDIQYKDLAEKMVFAGNEYEEITKLCPAEGLVVGKILECVNHPDSTKLHICKVDLGDSVKQIVCGAPNAREGIKVIVAKIGAKLPGGEIKEARLAGTLSEGMLCSLAELGLESKYVTEEDKLGIYEFSSDAIVGSDAIASLGYDDEYIDFELTSNRADLMSVRGMAHEISALYGKEIKLPKDDYNETNTNIEDIMNLSVETDKCSIYLGKLVENVEIKESPNWMKARLMSSGIRPINNVVDISNYVMMEYGQPLHFFDADKLGNKVIVRNASNDEKITTLDNQDRSLQETDIVIANTNEAVCLAGVMGGASTEVTNETKNIFVEAAIFDPYSIRYTSKRILRSEASMRYEKGIDPNITEKAIKRACHLLEKYASGKVAKGMLKHDTATHSDKVIDITLEKINQVLGMEIELDKVLNIFESLGFKVENESNLMHVSVPRRRLDISIKEDLIEEVGRIYGYDHVVGRLPLLNVKRGSRSKKASMVLEIREKLQALGLNQVITYSLTSKETANMFTDELTEDITLLDPMSEDKKVMRKSLIPSLLNVFDYNMARKNNDICIFETGSVYYKKNEEYFEESKVAGLLFGTYLSNDWQQKRLNVDFYLVKGIVETLLKYLGLNNRYVIKEQDKIKELHPGRSAQILVDGEVIGYLGGIHPSVCKKEVYTFELNVDKLLTKKVRTIKFKETPKYPSIHKDLAFVMKKDVTSETVMNILKRVGGRYLSNIDVFDVYVGENVLEDEKSIAYSLTFQDPTKTMTDEEVMTIFKNMISEVEKKTSAKLR